MLSCKVIPLKIESFSHLNSIFYSKDSKVTYVVANNSTAHTFRLSDIIQLNEDFSIRSILLTKVHSVHNVCEYKGELMYCDSNHWKLMLGEKCIFETDMLLRVLSINDDFIFIGGSDTDFTGKKRSNSDSFLYILNHDGHLTWNCKFEGMGNLKEIRQLEGADLAMSYDCYDNSHFGVNFS